METDIVVVLGALLAGFTTGFAGFGTGLVASGLWFHVLPAQWVPPLVALTSVVAQIVGLITVRRAFDWRRASPYLIGGVLGVPLGVMALSMATPALLRALIGAFLVVYGGYQLTGAGRRWRIGRRGRRADGLVGVTGGFLGGFAGLSGPLPLVWLQLQGGSADSQRATYQPFNLVVLAVASIAMSMSGQLGPPVLSLAAFCLPASVLGAMIGVRVYRTVAEDTFRRVVLILLLISGAILLQQSIAA
ncbi:MAG: sulfite exporter TauE/SafE family protein [Gammaproteobacteria bacterium]|nr:sulfite exporter TauE/SafE family protein [Gammaproteobacteria bacterium]